MKVFYCMALGADETKPSVLEIARCGQEGQVLSLAGQSCLGRKRIEGHPKISQVLGLICSSTPRRAGI